MALACAGAILYLLWNDGAFLPRWIVWDGGTWRDGTGEYEISLRGKEARVIRGDSVIWTSPPGVKVQEVISCDIDRDSEEELILLCWKIGRYGSRKPFWIDEDERRWSQHIFVYEYREGEIRPKWMSSYIGQDVAHMDVWDGGTSGKRLLLADLDGAISGWAWDSWGFTRVDSEVSFVVFGDNLIHEPIYAYGLRNGDSFDFLFENFTDVIAGSDVAVINQETPLVDDPLLYGGYPRFGTPVSVGRAIADAGFDVVTCATNHVLDRGALGVDFTKKFFDECGVKCLGIQAAEEKDYRPYEVIVKKDIRFALLNYTYGTNGIMLPEDDPHMVHLMRDEDRVRKDLDEAGNEADLVIVFVHWGTEYSEQPDEFQQKWARVFLEGGADVVVGAHPHALQPCEVLRDDEGREMLIYYSIGDFVSTRAEENRPQGGMAEFTVSLTPDGCRVAKHSLRPLTIVCGEGGRYTVVAGGDE